LGRRVCFLWWQNISRVLVMKRLGPISTRYIGACIKHDKVITLFRIKKRKRKLNLRAWQSLKDPHAVCIGFVGSGCVREGA
jgi:hypothetical protein